MNYRLMLFSFLLLAGQFMARGQDFSNKGKEFWIAYPAHVDGVSSVMGLYITASVNTTGTLELAGGTPLNFSVQANAVTRIFLNSTGTGTTSTSVYYAANTAVYQDQADAVKPNSAIKITMQDPSVVYSHIIKSARSAATLVLPTPVLGSSYIAPSMASTVTQGASSNGTLGGVGEITVVATSPNTIIGITPTAAGRNGRPSKTYFEVPLANAGDVYQFQSVNLGDLSGTTIISKAGAGASGCKPVAVYSATTWSSFDCSGASGGDNLYQQLFPTRSWGKTFVTAPFINRLNGDIFRILVQQSTTKIQIQENGITTTLDTLNAVYYNKSGRYYTYKTANPIIITGSDPISVAQYITSETCTSGCFTGGTNTKCFADPEMVILNPVEQTLQNITFFSAHKNFVPAGQTNVVLHFVNIIVSKTFKSSVKIDNAAPAGSFVDIPNSNYSYLQEDLTNSSATNPIHQVTADTSFSAIVYGYGDVESYGYNGGTNVKDFTPTATFQNPYNRIDSAVTCVNTPLQFSVPLSFVPSTIQWDFSAAPNISPNTTVSSNSPIADSTPVVNGISINYYSTKQTYTFIKSNVSSAVRDTVKLFTTTTTPDGCGSNQQSYFIPVKVNDQPKAAFTLTNTGCVTDTVHLMDQSSVASGSIFQWIWNFGDGSTDTLATNSILGKKYAAAGNYTIRLKVISDIGCISPDSALAVKITNKPIAKFTLPAIACAGSTLNFTDASSASAGIITKWTWNLDDGKGAFTDTTNVSVKTSYPVYGTKNPWLQVQMDNGCKSDTFFVSPQLQINPLPNVGFILPQICLNDANAIFTDTSSIAQGSNTFTYLWNFNAGTPAVSPGPNITTSTLKNPQVTYHKSDNYQVALTVTSALGCVSSSTVSFTVNGTTPKAGFNILNNLPYCGSTPIQLKNSSTVDFGGLTKLEIYWDLINNATAKFVDPSPGSGKTYQNIYVDPQLPSAQLHTIKLIAYSGSNACVDSVSQNIQLYPQPHALFSSSATQLCFGNTVSFTDKSNGVSSAAASWVWNLGGGDIKTVQNPIKQFNDSGLINISMYFHNADGCISDTATQQLTVYPNPILVLTHNLNALAGGSVKLIPVFVYGSSLQYLWTPATYLSSDTAASPISIPQDDITYQLLVTGIGGCSASDTSFIKVLKGPEVPNAFSPNGDGINDVWKIKYLDNYPGATVQVFNRFGQIVFSSVGYNKEWDGTYQGNALPIGTYYYIINPKNGRQTISGSVSIIK